MHVKERNTGEKKEKKKKYTYYKISRDRREGARGGARARRKRATTRVVGEENIAVKIYVSYDV